MGQDSIISQSFHFCCFRVLLKKKKKEDTVSEILKYPGSVSLPRGASGLSPPSSLLSLGGQCGWRGPSLHALSECMETFQCQLPSSPGPVSSGWLPAASWGSSCPQCAWRTEFNCEFPVLLPARTGIPRRSCGVGGFYASALLLLF